jgi:IS30 family transposase
MNYHYLTEEERYHIYESLGEDYSQRAIAKQLGRCKTVSFLGVGIE